ncbi:MAG TPA: diacylglycerol kinase family lipid kinase [Eubacteriaceae bacterium]|jgi:diacylglycerol kinase (ATP)|nr:diacylglycerol kinase family lipid kinase [Eubacteriaceae bacterium]
MGIYFIVNPIAGKGQTARLAQEFERILQERGIKYKIVFTEYPGHAAKLAAEIDDKEFSKVVSVGGDGTLNEILNGLNIEKFSLGIIPAGTGNDLIKSVDIPSNVMVAFEVVLSGEKRSIDIGYIQNKRFINVAGFGFDVEVLRETEKLKKIVKGKVAYVLGVIKAIISFKPVKLHISIDGIEYKREAMVCAIGNGQYFGGGMKILPKAELDDGLYDICIIKKLPKPVLLYHFPKVFKGTHLEIPWVEYLKGKNVKILTQEPVLVNFDGEVSQQEVPDFNIIKNGLNILVPKKSGTTLVIERQF